MSDRELLELAAKALNDPLISWGGGGFLRWIGYNEDMGCDVSCIWNPLNDDGDALRLAVKLELIVGHDAYDKLAYAQIRHPHFIATEFYGGTVVSADAAARRAIVLAAAEIGQTAPAQSHLTGAAQRNSACHRPHEGEKE